MNEKLRNLTTVEKTGTLIRNRMWKTEGTIVGSTEMGYNGKVGFGFNVLCTDGTERFLPFDRVDDWLVIEL